MDLSHIPQRHEAINLRLEEWAKWVRVKPTAWVMQPMWRFYRAPKQWEDDLKIKIEINTLAAHEVEKAVSALPEKHRTAIRWAYVKPYIPISKVQRELGVTMDALGELVHVGRVMLINAIKLQKNVDNAQNPC